MQAIPFLAIGASAFQGVMAIQAGKAQKQAYELEARAKEHEARVADLQTLQIAANRHEELNANLAAIEAVRAGRNTLSYSPSGDAVDAGFRRESQRALQAELLDPMQRAMSASYAARGARISGSSALKLGYANALGSFVDVAQGIAKLPTGKKTPKTTDQKSTAALY